MRMVRNTVPSMVALLSWAGMRASINPSFLRAHRALISSHHRFKRVSIRDKRNGPTGSNDAGAPVPVYIESWSIPWSSPMPAPQIFAGSVSNG